MNFTYRFHCNSEALLDVVTATLARRGLRVLRSFDLRSALSMQNSPAGAPRDCACPHHGTAACDCEYAVLLVYGGLPGPVVMIVHGRDGTCFVQVVEESAPPPDSRFARQLLGALMETARVMLARTEPAAPDRMTGAASAA